LSDDCLREIKNGFGKYLDKVEPKGSQFACAKNCVEVDLEHGFPAEINITLGDWKH